MKNDNILMKSEISQIEESEILLSIVIIFRNLITFLQDSANWRKSEAFAKKKIQIVLILDNGARITGVETILKQAFENFAMITFIQGRFGNPGSARNAGMEVSRGTWLVFWDSDDEPEPESLLIELDEVDATVDLIVNSYRLKNFSTGISENKVPAKKRPGTWLIDGLGIWRLAFRREKILDCRFPALSMGEDLIFFLLADEKLIGRKYSDRFTYSYIRGRAGQLTSNKRLIADQSPRAFFEAERMLSKSPTREQIFIYFRLFVTSFVKGQTKDKYRSFVLFSKRIFTHQDRHKSRLIFGLMEYCLQLLYMRFITERK